VEASIKIQCCIRRSLAAIQFKMLEETQIYRCGNGSVPALLSKHSGDLSWRGRK